jgi:hypothetical protein
MPAPDTLPADFFDNAPDTLPPDFFTEEKRTYGPTTEQLTRKAAPPPIPRPKLPFEQTEDDLRQEFASPQRVGEAIADFGGTPVQKHFGLPTASEAYDSVVENVGERFRALPPEAQRDTGMRGLAAASRFAASVGRIVPEGIDFATSPGGAAAIATLGPAARFAPRAVGAGLSATMAPEAYRATKEVIDNPTPETAGTAVKSAAMFGLPMLGMRRRPKPVEQPKIEPKPEPLPPPTQTAAETQQAQRSAKQAREAVEVPETGISEEAARLDDFSKRTAGKPLELLPEADQQAVRDLYAENQAGSGVREPKQMERLPSPPRRNEPDASSRRMQQRGSISAKPIEKQATPIEEEFLNFRRIKVSPQEEQNLRSTLREMAGKGQIAKDVEPHADVIAYAASIDPSLVAQVSAEGGIRGRAAQLVMRERLNALNREVVATGERLAKEPLTAEERAPLEKSLERMERDVKQYLGTVAGIRTESGRNLAALKITARNTLDLDWWVAEAKRSMRIPQGAELPEGKLKIVRSKVAGAQSAEAKLRTREQEIEAAKKRVISGLESRLNPRQGPSAVSPADRAGFEQDPKIQALRAELEIRRRELADSVAKLRENGWLETGVALWRAGLLTGVKTHARNIGGNVAFGAMEEASRVPAALVDMAISAKTGKRTTAGANPMAIIRASTEAATRGVREAKQIMQQGASSADLAKGEQKREWNFQGMSESLPRTNDMINRYINFVGRMLGAGDKIAKVYALRRSLEAQARIQALNDVRAGTITRADLNRRTSELVANPTDKISTEAIAYADFVTFNNENALAIGVERMASAFGPIGKAALAYELPFRRTPFNIFNRLMDYTPIGAVARPALAAYNAKRNGTAFDAQRVISEAFGRGTVGTGLLALGWYLGKQGLATGTGQEEPAKRNVQAAAGRIPGAIQAGGDWLKISAFAPGGALIQIGAQLAREGSRSVKDELKRPGNIAKVATRAVLEQPMLQSARETVEVLENPDSRAENFAASRGGSFVPAIVNDIATATNPERPASPPRGSGMASAAAHGVQSRLPFLRGKLPPQTDVFGRKPDARRSNAINPFTPSEAREQTDPLFKELIASDVGIGGVKQNVGESDADYRERKNLIGEYIEDSLRSILDSLPEDPQERREQIRKAVTKAKREMAKELKVEVEE